MQASQGGGGGSSGLYKLDSFSGSEAEGNTEENAPRASCELSVPPHTVTGWIPSMVLSLRTENTFCALESHLGPAM